MAIRQFRVNADSWTVLQDILVAIPEDFNHNGTPLRGRTINHESPSHVPNMGRLDGEHLSRFRKGLADHTIEYVIYSYETPIAWQEYIPANQRTDGHAHRWVMPDTRYSVTTSKHQGKVATALSQISGGI